MHSLNHLKTNYRPRYFNREGQKQAFDIQGENVLKYIQGCFETCANEFQVCSPAPSTWSSSSSSQEQDQVLSESKDKEKPECDKTKCIKDVNNAFNTFTFLPSPDRKDTCSGENEFEDAETSSKSHASSPENDIDMISLGSPALLMEEKSCEGISRFEDEGNEMDSQNSRDVGESAKYHSSTEVKELSVEEVKCSSSSKKERSKSLLSLEAITCSITQRNAGNVEPEEECEFLIEESFGTPSMSWISSSKRSPKAKKNSSKTVSSQQKPRTRQYDVKMKNKRGSQKRVTLSPVNLTEMESAKDGETTDDGSRNFSRTSEKTSTVDETSSTIQERNPQGLPSDDTSIETNSRDSNIGNLTEDQASLLKQTPIVLKPAISTSCSSVSKKTVKQKKSKAKPSVETRDQGRPECVTPPLSSEDSRWSQDTSMHSNDTVSTLTPIGSLGPTSAQLSARTPTKSFKRQKSQVTTSSKKTVQIPRNNVEGSSVKITQRRRKILDSEECFPSDREDEPWNKDDENRPPNETQRGSSSGKKPRRKGRRALSTSPAGNSSGSASIQEDSSERYLTEKGLNASMQQQNRNAHLARYSCAADVNMNNISGPIVGSEKISEHNISSNWDDLNSGNSGDSAEDIYQLVSNSQKHKLVLPTNTPNVRRTKRTRMRPLEYWRGERVNYKTRPSGGFVIGGIISPEQKDPRKPRKTRKPVVELADMLDNSTVSLKDPSQPAVVFDAASNQEILLECVRSGSSHLFTIDNETLSIYKYLTTPSFSAGKMILKPLKEKGCQYSHTDTLVFHITRGKLLLTMYDQCYSLTVGDYFFIPAGNVYNIRNLLNKECVILFTQLKGNKPQS